MNLRDLMKGLLNRAEEKLDPVGAFIKKPLVRRAALQAESEYVEKQASNLRLVGRLGDAEKVVSGYLDKIFDAWKEEPRSPEYLRVFANAAMKLGALEKAKAVLKAVIEVNQGEAPFLDLTPIYFDLGRVYHQLHADFEKELWCFHMATLAEAPPNCLFPASLIDKAIAHNFAFVCANRIGNKEHARWHDYKMREIAPDVDWENPFVVISLMRGWRGTQDERPFSDFVGRFIKTVAAAMTEEAGIPRGRCDRLISFLRDFPALIPQIGRCEADANGNLLFKDSKTGTGTEQRALFNELIKKYPEAEWLATGYFSPLLAESHVVIEGTETEVADFNRYSVLRFFGIPTAGEADQFVIEIWKKESSAYV